MYFINFNTELSECIDHVSERLATSRNPPKNGFNTLLTLLCFFHIYFTQAWRATIAYGILQSLLVCSGLP